MAFIAEILEYAARGLFSAHEYEGGFWLMLVRAFFG